MYGTITAGDRRIVSRPRSAQRRQLTYAGHINNLYNTTFWAIVLKGGLSAVEAEKKLSGTYSSDKNEMLFSDYRINYNNEPEMFKKGSVLFRDVS
jgi:tRNA(His) guanylyltransferase